MAPCLFALTTTPFAPTLVSPHAAQPPFERIGALPTAPMTTRREVVSTLRPCMSSLNVGSGISEATHSAAKA